MKKRITIFLFVLAWITGAFLWLLPSMLILLTTGRDVWNGFMNKAYIRFTILTTKK